MTNEINDSYRRMKELVDQKDTNGAAKLYQNASDTVKDYPPFANAYLQGILSTRNQVRIQTQCIEIANRPNCSDDIFKFIIKNVIAATPPVLNTDGVDRIIGAIPWYKNPQLGDPNKNCLRARLHFVIITASHLLDFPTVLDAYNELVKLDNTRWASSNPFLKTIVPNAAIATGDKATALEAAGLDDAGHSNRDNILDRTTYAKILIAFGEFQKAVKVIKSVYADLKPNDESGVNLERIMSSLREFAAADIQFEEYRVLVNTCSSLNLINDSKIRYLSIIKRVKTIDQLHSDILGEASSGVRRSR